MRCCAPFCKNTSDDVSTESKGISFHAFPSEVGLRAAWLRALGKQDSLLPDSAVVCSQHFLDDDICATGSGLRQLAPGAVPSTVQVCMICLDTDSRLFLMSKHKMDKAYEKLTGYPPCDVGNLKQALCIQCAQRLRTFSRFRDKSLRAGAIMMDLVEKHELITRQHIKMINRTKNQLDNSFVMTTLGPDPCDLHIQEPPSEEQQTDLEVTLQTVEVKKEDRHPSEEQQNNSEATLQKVEVKLEVCYDSMYDEDMTVANNDSIADYYVKDEFFAPDNSISEDSKILDDALSQARERNQTVVDQVDQIQGLLKYESALFQCFLCYEEFEAEPAYKLHMGMHGQAGAGGGERAASPARKARAAASSSCPDTALRTPHRRAVQKVQRGLRSTDLHQPAVAPLCVKLETNHGNNVQAEEADTAQKRRQVLDIYNAKPDNRPFVTDGETYINLANRVVKTYAGKKPKKFVPLQSESLVIAQRAATISMDSNFQVSSQDEDVKPVTNQMNVNNFNAYKTSKRKAKCINVDSSENSLLSERNWFSCERNLILPMRTLSEIKLFFCKFCQYKSVYRRHLLTHMRTHTGQKPFLCELCDYRSADKSNLARHVKTHTGEKPYICKLCDYRCARTSHLERHMRTHIGKKPFCCDLCDYRSAHKSYLARHVKTHTGQKPYTVTPG